MSRLVTAGNVVIPGTITVTVNNSHITPLDDLRVILNITGAGAVTLDDGTDTTQRVEVMNKSATACNLTYTAVGGSVTVQLGTNKGARLLWVGGYWKATLAGLITGYDNDGNPIEYLGEATIDTKVAPQQYSTTEQLTGSYWIDGKPIYRQTIFTSYTTYTVDPSGTNPRRTFEYIVPLPIENLVSVNGYVHYNGTSPANQSFGSVRYSQTNTLLSSIFAFMSQSNSVYLTCYFYDGWDVTQVDYRVTLEYTKTTE